MEYDIIELDMDQILKQIVRKKLVLDELKEVFDGTDIEDVFINIGKMALILFSGL